MPVMRQLGDPAAAAACLCQHHEEAYAEWETLQNPMAQNVVFENFADGATIVQVPITITETCCVVVNTAMVSPSSHVPTSYEIERPLGTIRTQQEDAVAINDLVLFHHAAWEVLPAGAYTYFLVNRHGGSRTTMAAWIKAVASDCLG